MNTAKYILNYIDFQASETIAQRGRTLYRNKKVTALEYEEKKDLWTFHVYGSEEYTVKVQGINNQNLDSACSCPYGWNRLCKHSIAALHHIINNDPPEPELPNEVKEGYRNSVDDHYEIDDYNPLTDRWVYQNTDSYTYNKLRYIYMNATIDKFEVYSNSLLFHITLEYNQFSVIFRKENNRIFVSSNDTTKTTKLKLPEAYCLLAMLKSNSENLLEKLLFNSTSNLQQETLQSFGLPNDAEFEEYFTYHFSLEDGLSIVPTKKAEGIIPINENFSTPLLEQIEKINTTPEIQEIQEKRDHREIGFVICFVGTYYDDYLDHDFSDNTSVATVIPIIGKTNKAKTALTSFIEEYSELLQKHYNIALTEQSEELINLINLLETEEHAPTAFQYRQRIFALLQNEQYVFTLKNNEFEVKKSSLLPVNLSEEAFDICYEISTKGEFIQSDLQLLLHGEPLKLNKINKHKSDSTYITIDDTCYCAKNYQTSLGLIENSGPIKMVKSHKNIFLEKVIMPLSRNFIINFKKGTFKKETVEFDFHKKQVFLTEKNGFLVITPKVIYDQNTSVALYQNGNIINSTNDGITEYTRNFELEDDFINQIAELHPNFELQKSKRIFYLAMNSFVENMWFYKFFDQLTALNIEVFGLKDLNGFKYSPYKGKISTSVSSGQDWFEVNLDISFGDNSVSLKDIRKAVLKKEQYIRLKDGSVGVMPNEWFRRLEKYFRNGEIREDKLEISKLRFSIIDELFDNIDDSEILLELAEKKERLSYFKEITETQVPKSITAELRPYQKEGLNWLNFLNEMKWGGILADDMGLGKTLQVLTFIQHLALTNRQTNLIVVPTSLLFNWENEIRKFSPNLKALYHYGSDRATSTNDFANYDLVFTTYGILLRDIKMLQNFTFNYVILDESQAIKNPASRRYKAANLIQASNRLALSGTPIENSTFDLFAQMNFVNRGLFGSMASFKENYSNPIDKEGNDLMASELQKIVSPFVLRRTKENVAHELPPKTEDYIYCEMETEQRKVYEAYRNNYKTKLLKTIDDQGVQKSKLMVLEALTRLRQICDSPQLLSNDNIDCTESVKINEIVRHITNKTANHKILIFSQFVKMLTLVKSELDKLNIKYEYLDGKCSKSQREKSVNNFQEDDNLRVFLISLKAGGTGLNLTAADYVYILDPWWNPAVENQAIDRCYRIGQDKTVFAYRMICKNTIEEKIMNLQQKKNRIAADIIQTDENLMKNISSDDIKELFS